MKHETWHMKLRLGLTVTSCSDVTCTSALIIDVHLKSHLPVTTTPVHQSFIGFPKWMGNKSNKNTTHSTKMKYRTKRTCNWFYTFEIVWNHFLLNLSRATILSLPGLGTLHGVQSRLHIRLAEVEESVLAANNLFIQKTSNQKTNTCIFLQASSSQLRLNVDRVIINPLPPPPSLKYI